MTDSIYLQLPENNVPISTFSKKFLCNTGDNTGCKRVISITLIMMASIVFASGLSLGIGLGGSFLWAKLYYTLDYDVYNGYDHYNKGMCYLSQFFLKVLVGCFLVTIVDLIILFGSLTVILMVSALIGLVISSLWMKVSNLWSKANELARSETP